MLSEALNGTRTYLPAHSHRHLELTLPMLGMYAVEVLRIYTSFEPNNHTNLSMKCSKPHVALSARIAVTPQSLAPSPPPVSDAMRWIPRYPVSESPELPTRIQRSMNEHISLARHHSFQWAHCSRSGLCEAAKCPSCALRRSCFAGDSHARDLCAQVPGCTHIWIRFADVSPSAEARALEGIGNNSVFDMARMSAQGDHYTNLKPFEEIAQSCLGADLFVQVGQWDFGWPGGLSPFHHFHHSLLGLLERLRFLRLGQHRSGHAMLPGNRMFLLTTNYNPMGARILSCPPSEWRTPPIINEANRIIADAGVHFGLDGSVVRLALCPVLPFAPRQPQKPVGHLLCSHTPCPSALQ